MSSAAFGAMLFVLFVVIGILVGAAIGAVLLRAAVAVYNRITGTAKSPASIPEPSIGKAMGITFLTTLVNLVAAFLILFVTGMGISAAGASGKWIGQALSALQVEARIVA